VQLASTNHKHVRLLLLLLLLLSGYTWLALQRLTP
jgi:hypothetical protein